MIHALLAVFVSPGWARDLDCDGYEDIVAHGVDAEGAPAFLVFLGGPASGTPPVSLEPDPAACELEDSPLVTWVLSHPDAVSSEETRAFADLDRDGVRDLVWLRGPGEGLTLLYGAADGFSERDAVRLDAGWVVMVVPRAALR